MSRWTCVPKSCSNVISFDSYRPDRQTDRQTHNRLIALPAPQSGRWITQSCSHYLTRGTYGLPESPFQTASRSVRPFLYGSHMLCCTMLWQWERNPKIAHSPWDFVTPPNEDRDTAIGNMYEKFGKDRARCSGDMLEDRQKDTHTQTDVLITILRNRFRERSNKRTWWSTSVSEAALMLFCVVRS